jgi:hypothetical protein
MALSFLIQPIFVLHNNDLSVASDRKWRRFLPFSLRKGKNSVTSGPRWPRHSFWFVIERERERERNSQIPNDEPVSSLFLLLLRAIRSVRWVGLVSRCLRSASGQMKVVAWQFNNENKHEIEIRAAMGEEGESEWRNGNLINFGTSNTQPFESTNKPETRARSKRFVKCQMT